MIAYHLDIIWLLNLVKKNYIYKAKKQHNFVRHI